MKHQINLADVDLVEDVIPEELEHVPVASLSPRLVHVQLRSVNLFFHQMPNAPLLKQCGKQAIFNPCVRNFLLLGDSCTMKKVLKSTKFHQII